MSRLKRAMAIFVYNQTGLCCPVHFEFANRPKEKNEVTSFLAEWYAEESRNTLETGYENEILEILSYIHGGGDDREVPKIHIPQ
jgi:hypothetical protein